MTHDRITRLTLDAQRRIFRLAQRDHGLTLKSISIDSGIHYDTLRCYAGNKGEQSVLSVPALVKLAGIIPDDLLSQVLAPADRHLERNPDDGDTDLDDLADSCGEVEREVRKARHPKSPGGTEIVAIEEERIRRAARRLGRAA